MSPMRHSAKLRLSAAAIAVPCIALAQASPVETIYSAEHALYGSGYAIGVADGWIDDALRTAISNYQSDTRGLKPSGHLDPATLSALGVESRSTGTISDNPVSDRSAALFALGLEENDLPTPTAVAEFNPAPIMAVADTESLPKREPGSEPGPVPQPEPRIVTRAEPDEVKTTPTVGGSDNTEPESPSAQARPDPEVASSDPRAALSPFPVPIASIPDEQVEAQPEPSPAESQTVSEASVPEPAEDADEASGSPAETQTETEGTLGASTDHDFDLPEEPTAAGKAESESMETAHAVQTSHAMSSRGFFASLFDFLFGWMI